MPGQIPLHASRSEDQTASETSWENALMGEASAPSLPQHFRTPSVDERPWRCGSFVSLRAHIEIGVRVYSTIGPNQSAEALRGLRLRTCMTRCMTP